MIEKFPMASRDLHKFQLNNAAPHIGPVSRFIHSLVHVAAQTAAQLNSNAPEKKTPTCNEFAIKTSKNTIE
jgi:hypothetical protein